MFIWLILYHSISISGFYCCLYVVVLNCIDAQDCGLKRIEKVHCSPDIPWHPLTIASSGSGFAVEGASVDGASCWHHGNCLCHYLTFEWASKSRLLEGTHDDAWWCMMMHDIVNRKQTMIMNHNTLAEQQLEMRKHVHLTHSISISAIAFSWSWNCIEVHKIVSRKGGSCTAPLTSPDIPWHPL